MSLGLVSVRADDTPAQAAARAALMEKMADLDQANGAADTTTSAPPVAPAAPEATAPATTPSTPSQTPDNTPPPVIVNSSGAAPESNETPVVTSTPTDTTTSVPAQPVVSPPMEPVSPPPVSMPSTEFSTVPPPSGVEARVPAPSSPSSGGYNEAAQAALSQSQTNAMVVSAPPATQPPSAPVASQPATPSVNNTTAKELGLNPIQPPPPPVSAEQQQELQALLQRYEADQITPEEYQAERAKIMAGQ